LGDLLVQVVGLEVEVASRRVVGVGIVAVEAGMVVWVAVGLVLQDWMQYQQVHHTESFRLGQRSPYSRQVPLLSFSSRL
jgi:hypothetical protein